MNPVSLLGWILGITGLGCSLDLKSKFVGIEYLACIGNFTSCKVFADSLIKQFGWVGAGAVLRTGQN